jgi:hypothetical protein
LRGLLRSTGLPPHYLSVEIIPYDRFRISMPVDAPLVYESSEYRNITGGTGQDLAEQVTKKLHLTARP